MEEANFRRQKANFRRQKGSQSSESHAPTLLRRPDRPPPPAPLHSAAPTTPRHALAATVAKKPEEIAAPPPAPPAAESGKGAEKAEKNPKEAANELEAESSEMKPKKDTAAPPPSTPPQARPTIAIGGFAFVPVGSLAADQPPGGVGLGSVIVLRLHLAEQVKRAA
ncbi:hypothetical protein GUJ93_ZPchr0015g6842 [Zizania palustris]|uniref:Uncharacterized protein n=1 Tax=Zizania palustris TaxID=103762 RepID=A0A8J5W141_ZIZPA|nr:hypothetical protein GUJ93_ZPchr0015g6842 [Zizania palustris]